MLVYFLLFSILVIKFVIFMSKRKEPIYKSIIQDAKAAKTVKIFTRERLLSRGVNMDIVDKIFPSGI